MIKPEGLFNYLALPRKAAIITHSRPDGDAIGSSLALKHLLEKQGHIADIIAPDEFPSFLDWMPGTDSIFIYQKKPKTCFAVLTNADILFFLDFNSLKRIERLGEEILKLNRPVVKVMIDHHRDPEEFTDYSIWNDKASSTAELIYEFMEMGAMQHEMDENIAACLYTGIIMDTGMFQFSNTTARTHEIAAALIDSGINIEKIYNDLYNQYGENRLRFIGHLLSQKLQLLPEQRAAYMVISMQEAEQFKLNSGDKEGIVNLPLVMKDVDMSALFTEDKGRIKISFRSKGEMNVDRLARIYFNGGGHKNASGGSASMSLDEAVNYFIKILPQFLTDINQ